ncbi:hypothetical protein LB505_001158 [Fusarium chuoi]|nr:hypothetical protein LB505_001158 [Fusarium chuoi]
MATIVPPPSKRQKREELERSQIQQDVTALASGPAGSFKARFLDGDGKQMADVIEVPLADASEKNLSLLLNTLLARRNSSHIDSEFTSQILISSWTNTLPISSSFFATMALRIPSKRLSHLVPSHRLSSRSSL